MRWFWLGITALGLAFWMGGVRAQFSQFSDEFNGPATLANWQRLYQTEQWPANQRLNADGMLDEASLPPALGSVVKALAIAGNTLFSGGDFNYAFRRHTERRTSCRRSRNGCHEAVGPFEPTTEMSLEPAPREVE